MSLRFLNGLSRVVVIASAVIGLPVVSAHAQVVFTDGTFNNSDWSNAVMYSHGNGGSFTAGQRTGGNPGSTRENVININSVITAGDFSTLFVFSMRSGAVYTPTLAGAITTIDYSEDAIMFSGFGNGQSGGIALLQGGSYYILSSFPAINFSTWTAMSSSGLTAASFSRVNASGSAVSLDTTSHPDFSAVGAPISLGYWRGTGSSGAVQSGFTINTGIDNWRVSVNQVIAAAPEPTTLALFTIGIGASFVRARRRRAYQSTA